MASEVKDWEEWGYDPLLGGVVTSYNIYQYPVGTVVWAKAVGWPWWPAMVKDHHPVESLIIVQFFEWNDELVHMPYTEVKPWRAHTSASLLQRLSPEDTQKWKKVPPEEHKCYQQAMQAAEKHVRTEVPRPTLRAGDLIQFKDPFDNNVRTSRIVQVHTPQRQGSVLMRLQTQVALIMSNSVVKKAEGNKFGPWKWVNDFALIPSFSEEAESQTEEQQLKRIKKVLEEDLEQTDVPTRSLAELHCIAKGAEK